MKSWKYFLLTTMAGLTFVLGACGSDSTEGAEAESDISSSEAGEPQAEGVLEGKVSGDGSSTVAPILEAVVEEYAAEQSEVQVTVGVSGTGGGFEKFIAGDTDFSNASRPIKEEEKQKLAEANIDFSEFQIAYDGLSLVVNKENDWVDS